MTAAWWEHLAELLDEAAEYLADHELSTADYLSRAAWMAHAISEEEAAGGSGAYTAAQDRGGAARGFVGDAGVAVGEGTNLAGGHRRLAVRGGSNRGHGRLAERRWRR